MNRLLVIVGPTGTGKSRLAIRLARLFNGEIVNADSVQVYRFMDIGTAKPSADELKDVSHHLFDLISPDQTLNVAEYQERAYDTIKQVHGRNRLPVITGGSGQYVWSVIEGWRIPRVAPDNEFRRQLEQKAEVDSAGLYNELARLNPEAAAKIHPQNVRRVIRALEILKHSGGGLTGQPEKTSPPYVIAIIGLTASREEVYRLVDARVEMMVQQGLAGEVQHLFNMGYDSHLPALNSIGYKEIGQYLRNEMSLDEAKKRMKHETHRLVRHQYAWFRLTDYRIHWFDIISGAENSIIELVKAFLTDAPATGIYV